MHLSTALFRFPGPANTAVSVRGPLLFRPAESARKRMYVDDRLATVLRARVGGSFAAVTQFRQLVDLLGTLPSEARGEQVDAAWARLAEVSAEIPVEDRAAALREPGLRLRSSRLIAELARTGAPVASAALGAARLTEAQWLDLVPALPVQIRGLVRQRTDLGPKVEGLLSRLGIAPRGLPSAGAVTQIAANDVNAPREGRQNLELPPAEGIGAIVRRIEAYRKRKAEAGLALADQPPAPEAATLASGPVDAFAFTCDERGRINWAEACAAPATIGLRIGTSDAASAVVSASAVVEAFRRRQPIRCGRVGVCSAPTFAGAWQLDASPIFDPFGHFTGYRGRFRRPPSQAAQARATPDSSADRVRQILHELRTPVNAIQGFAEVIQQQLFGPTPHEYRAHAAAIAGDAARMLAGFEEMDRLARLNSGAMTLDPGTCDMAAVTQTLVGQLNTHLGQRSSGFDLALDPGVLPVALDAAEAERLCWRLLATLAGVAAPGEKLKIRLRRKRQMIRLGVELPGALSIKDDLFHASPPPAASPLSAGMFGAGFALRLAAAEARSAGGDLVRRDARIRLELPEAAGGLTQPAPDHNQKEGFTG